MIDGCKLEQAQPVQVPFAGELFVAAVNVSGFEIELPEDEVVGNVRPGRFHPHGDVAEFIPLSDCKGVHEEEIARRERAKRARTVILESRSGKSVVGKNVEYAADLGGSVCPFVRHPFLNQRLFKNLFRHILGDLPQSAEDDAVDERTFFLIDREEDVDPLIARIDPVLSIDGGIIKSVLLIKLNETFLVRFELIGVKIFGFGAELLPKEPVEEF